MAGLAVGDEGVVRDVASTTQMSWASGRILVPSSGKATTVMFSCRVGFEPDRVEGEEKLVVLRDPRAGYPAGSGRPTQRSRQAHHRSGAGARVYAALQRARYLDVRLRSSCL